MPSVQESIRMASDHAQAGRLEQAVALLRRAVQQHPGSAEAHHKLGQMLFLSGKAEQSFFYFERAARLSPQQGEPMSDYGAVLAQVGRFEESRKAYAEALKINENLVGANVGMGNVTRMLGEYDVAERHLERALSLAPNNVEARTGLSGVYHFLGKMEESNEQLRIALRIDPNNFEAWSKLLSNLIYMETTQKDELFQAHVKYGEAMRRALPIRPLELTNTPDPERPLRVGYVSPDMWGHSVSYFAEPLFEHHTRPEFTVYVYATTEKNDRTTERLKEAADHWRQDARIPDKALRERIAADRVDILVDLCGHMQANRLRLFHARAAPVQVTAIGYPHTTGLATMDYRLVDSYTDPAPTADAYAIEKLERLDPCFLCYRPMDDAPDPAPPPSLAAGHITFGSFNSQQKMSPSVVRAWARIVREVPGSRLIIKNKRMEGDVIRDLFRAAFAAEGVEPDRLELHPMFPFKREHMEFYGRLDVALDTFPYTGTTTTCEAMWMGVPVVSLVGDSHASRVGLSLLTNVGLPDLVVGNVEDYIKTAKAVALDTERRVKLRTGLRGMMRASPLLDGPGYAKRVEAAYRRMWRAWCASRV